MVTAICWSLVQILWKFKIMPEGHTCRTPRIGSSWKLESHEAAGKVYHICGIMNKKKNMDKVEPTSNHQNSVPAALNRFSVRTSLFSNALERVMLFLMMLGTCLRIWSLREPSLSRALSSYAKKIEISALCSPTETQHQ